MFVIVIQQHKAVHSDIMVYGPFNSKQEAEDWATDHCVNDGNWYRVEYKRLVK